uniref:O-antigen ligase-related domain-containing protein n=1 Tax=candidate division WWE3 bacterium TaxID=2053526 RepID=A0A7C4TLU8_UNCKA
MFPKVLTILFSSCFVLLSLGQLGVISRASDLKVYFFDFAIFSYVLVGLTYLLFVKRKFFIPKIYSFYILLLVWMVLTFTVTATNFGVEQRLVALSYLVRFATYFVAALVAKNLLNMKIIKVKKFLDLLFFTGFLFSLAGFAQLVLFPDFTELDSSLGLDPHKNRLASTFLDPNFAGGYLAFILSTALGTNLFNFYKWTSIKKVLYILVPLLALFLTFSRSSWAMLAVVVLVYGFFKSRKLLVLSLLLMACVYFAIPRVQTRLSGTTDPADSAAFRLISWKNAFEIAQDNLIFGVGYNTYRYAQQDYGFITAGETGGNSGAGADSSLLLALATTGGIGLALFIWPIFYAIYESIFLKRTFIVAATLLGLVIHSQFVNSLFYPPILFMWLLFLDFDYFKKTFDT